MLLSNTSFNGVASLVLRDDIDDDKIRDEIPESVTKIEVITGHNFDPRSLKIDEDVPATKEFRIYKYKNPKT